jgi:hypothetical protein
MWPSMTRVSIIAATVRTTAGFSGCGLGYVLATNLLATVERDVTAESWELLVATDSFVSMVALFGTLSTIGGGVLFAYFAQGIFDYLIKRNARSSGKTASDTSVTM